MKFSRGFTLIEVLTTVVVAALFLIAIFQLMTVVTTLSARSSYRTAASNLAYNNLRLYANGQPPLWFDCIGDEAGEDTPPFSDGTRSGATGQVLVSTTSETSVQSLPPPVSQSVVAVAPYGCGESGLGLPIRVQSQVTFGPPTNSTTVTHATYVSY